ncbi:hypothetical protein AB0J84_31865 [Micromonospora arborensis]|uniref:hypothetical protein n=1 Tax=Micromonospora arborensis TaxID=2116518 RepID=UPI00341E7D28
MDDFPAGGRNFMEMPAEYARILWRHGGWGTDADFPGRTAALFRMVRGVTPAGRRTLGRHFAALAVHCPAAVVALLRLILPPARGSPLCAALAVPKPGAPPT